MIGSRKDLYHAGTGEFAGYLYAEASDIQNSRYVFTDASNTTCESHTGAIGCMPILADLGGRAARLGVAALCVPLPDQSPMLLLSHAVAAAARVLSVLLPVCRRRSLGRCCEGQPGDLRLQTAGPVRQPGEAQGSA